MELQSINDQLQAARDYASNSDYGSAVVYYEAVLNLITRWQLKLVIVFMQCVSTL